MNKERLYKVITSPHVSEKASIIADKNKQITFKVDKSSTKLEVKNAVEHLFDVKVKSVNMVNIKGKTKRFKQMLGKRNNVKKAYVTLQEGYDIDFAEAE